MTNDKTTPFPVSAGLLRKVLAALPDGREVDAVLHQMSPADRSEALRMAQDLASILAHAAAGKASAPPVPPPQPVAIRIECPDCHKPHIDEGEFATKPHHTHACQHCGLVWRPALVPTVGVRFLPGFRSAAAPAAGSIEAAETAPAAAPAAARSNSGAAAAPVSGAAPSGLPFREMVERALAVSLAFASPGPILRAIAENLTAAAPPAASSSSGAAALPPVAATAPPIMTPALLTELERATEERRQRRQLRAARRPPAQGSNSGTAAAPTTETGEAPSSLPFREMVERALAVSAVDRQVRGVLGAMSNESTLDAARRVADSLDQSQDQISRSLNHIEDLALQIGTAKETLGAHDFEPLVEATRRVVASKGSNAGAAIRAAAPAAGSSGASAAPPATGSNSGASAAPAADPLGWRFRCLSCNAGILPSDVTDSKDVCSRCGEKIFRETAPAASSNSGAAAVRGCSCMHPCTCWYGRPNAAPPAGVQPPAAPIMPNSKASATVGLKGFDLVRRVLEAVAHGPSEPGMVGDTVRAYLHLMTPAERRSFLDAAGAISRGNMRPTLMNKILGTADGESPIDAARRVVAQSEEMAAEIGAALHLLQVAGASADWNIVLAVDNMLTELTDWRMGNLCWRMGNLFRMSGGEDTGASGNSPTTMPSEPCSSLLEEFRASESELSRRRRGVEIMQRDGLQVPGIGKATSDIRERDHARDVVDSHWRTVASARVAASRVRIAANERVDAPAAAGAVDLGVFEERPGPLACGHEQGVHRHAPNYSIGEAQRYGDVCSLGWPMDMGTISSDGRLIDAGRSELYRPYQQSPRLEEEPNVEGDSIFDKDRLREANVALDELDGPEMAIRGHHGDITSVISIHIDDALSIFAQLGQWLLQQGVVPPPPESWQVSTKREIGQH